jgi:hypothetical protein
VPSYLLQPAVTGGKEMANKRLFPSFSIRTRQLSPRQSGRSKILASSAEIAGLPLRKSRAVKSTNMRQFFLVDQFHQ